MADTTEKKQDGKKDRRVGIHYINNNDSRSTTFSKRKRGLFKKANEIETLTGCEVIVIIASPKGHVFTYASQTLAPVIINPAFTELVTANLTKGSVQMQAGNTNTGDNNKEENKT